MRYFKYAVCIVVFVSVVVLVMRHYGQKEKQTSIDMGIFNFENQLTALKLQQQSLENKVADLEVQLNKVDLGLLETIGRQTSDDHCHFSPSAKGYGKLKTASGLFLVSLKDITPYASAFD